MDSINNVANKPFLISNAEKGQVKKNGDFQEILKTLVSNVDKQIKEANQLSEEFAIGKKRNLSEIMIASNKAELSLKFLIQIRNKLLEAYQEITRMHF